MQTKFDEFHQSHPEVYERLVKMCRLLTSQGHKHISLRMVYEVLRFRNMLRRRQGERFTLNNNYCPYYQRLIIAQEPDLRGVFESRKSKADDDPLSVDWNSIFD